MKLNKKLIEVSINYLNKVPYIKNSGQNEDDFISIFKIYALKMGYFFNNIPNLDEDYLKKVLKVLANIKGLDLNWKNTLFSFDEIKQNEELCRIETLHHYISTYGLNNFEDPYYPNEMNKEDKSKFKILKKEIETLNITDVIELKFELSDRVFIELANFYEKYSRPLTEIDFDIINKYPIYIKLENITFKENQMKFIDNGYKNIKPEALLRYIKYKLNLSPNLTYCKGLKQIKSYHLEKELKKNLSELSFYVIENNFDDFVKLLKQKRKLVKKLLAIIEYNKNYSNLDYLLKNNRNLQEIKSKYSILDKTLNINELNEKELKDVVRDKFIEFYRTYGKDLTESILYKMSLKNQIQVYNYIQKTKNRVLNIYDNDLYILPNNSFIKEYNPPKIKLNEIKELNTISDNLLKEIKIKFYNIIKDKGINKELYNFLFENDIKYPLSIRIDKNTPFIYELGSSLNFNKDNKLRAGIYWKGLVDYDLSAITENGIKIGWNSNYNKNGIIFSGDVTSAPNGGSEFIQVNNPKENIELNVNLYSNNTTEFYCGIMTDIRDSWDKEDIDIDDNYKYFNPEFVKVGYKAELNEDMKQVTIAWIDVNESKFYPLYIKSNFRVSSGKPISNDLIKLNKNKLSISNLLTKDLIKDNGIKDLNELVKFLLTNLY